MNQETDDKMRITSASIRVLDQIAGRFSDAVLNCAIDTVRGESRLLVQATDIYQAATVITEGCCKRIINGHSSPPTSQGET